MAKDESHDEALADDTALQNELDELKEKLEQLEKSNSELIAGRAKAATQLEELGRLNGESGGATPETIERMTDLEVEAEVMLADLEARQAEAEDNDSEVARASGEVQRKFDAARME